MKIKNPVKSIWFWIFLLIFVVIVLFQKHPAKTEFFITKDTTASLTNEPKLPVYVIDFIPQPSYLKQSYSPALTRLQNGDLLCFFFAGSKEGATDVNIYKSKYSGGKWGEPVSVVSPKLLSRDTKRLVRKIGNPAVFTAPDGKVHLFVASVTVGGWAGARLNHMISNDNGETWSHAVNLKLTPFMDISNNCRTAPVPLADGGFYLPLYYEMILCYPELARFDAEGKFIDKIRLNNNTDLLQPALMTIDKENAFVYFRNKGDTDKIVYYQQTKDGGLTWGKLAKTNFEAPNSSLVAQCVNKDLYIIVCNVDNRRTLVIKSSADGKNWKTLHTLDTSELDVTYAYPAIIMNGDTIDLIYAWNDRAALKHIRFNKQWLIEEARK